MAYFLAKEDEEVIFYDEPNVLEKLPKDLQEFVVKEENVPYLIVAKQQRTTCLCKLTETEMKFLIRHPLASRKAIIYFIFLYMKTSTFLRMYIR